jgi:hypothetical protein
MSQLTLQEVIDGINKNYFLMKREQPRKARIEEQPHRPEFYVPRIARRLASLTLGISR